MPVSINRIILAGNLTRDPQIRFLANEKSICEFGLAINRKFKGGDGEFKEEVTFVDIEAWGRTGELAAQYLTKGRSCLVEGRLKLDQWEDKDTQQKRSRLKVVADSIQFLDDAKADRQEHDAAPVASPTVPRAPTGGGDDSEPPFSRFGEEFQA